MRSSNLFRICGLGLALVLCAAPLLSSTCRADDKCQCQGTCACTYPCQCPASAKAATAADGAYIAAKEKARVRATTALALASNLDAANKIKPPVVTPPPPPSVPVVQLWHGDPAAAKAVALKSGRPLVIWVGPPSTPIVKSLPDCTHLHVDVWLDNKTPGVYLDNPSGNTFFMPSVNVTEGRIRQVLNRPAASSDQTRK